MPTFTTSRRVIVVAAIGLVLSPSLAGCSLLARAAPSDFVGCSLLFIDGSLVADDGRVVLLPNQSFAAWGPRVPLDFPDGWTVRPIDDGQLEVVDDAGTVRAHTEA